jgi:hypothetical protein
MLNKVNKCIKKAGGLIPLDNICQTTSGVWLAGEVALLDKYNFVIGLLLLNTCRLLSGTVYAWTASFTLKLLAAVLFGRISQELLGLTYLDAPMSTGEAPLHLPPFIQGPDGSCWRHCYLWSSIWFVTETDIFVRSIAKTLNLKEANLSASYSGASPD